MQESTVLTQTEALEQLRQLYVPDMSLCLVYVSEDCTQGHLISDRPLTASVTDTQLIAAALMKTYDPELDAITLANVQQWQELFFDLQLAVWGRRCFSFIAWYIPFGGHRESR